MATGPEALYLGQLLAGGAAVHPIAVAARLRLADLLDGGPRSVGELAAATATREESLLRLLRALAGLGIVRPDGDRRFALAPVGRLLRDGAPGSLRSVAELAGAPWRAAAYDLLDAVRDGGSPFARRFGAPLYPWLEAHPDEAATFHAVQASKADALDLLPAVDAAAPAPATIVDVGGGSGALLARLLRARPSLRGVLFDLPSAIRAARVLPEEPSLAGRLQLVEGDFLDGVPGGGDLYLLAFVLHNWDDHRAARILARCAAAMRPGARLFVVEQLLDQSPAPQAALLDLEMLVFHDGGRERDLAGYRALVEEAGLSLRGTHATASSAALLDAVKR